MPKTNKYSVMILTRSSWTSVVRGAVTCEYLGLGAVTPVNTRLSRWNFGVTYHTTYNASEHDLLDRYKDTETGLFKAKNQVDWLVRKVSLNHTPTSDYTDSQLGRSNFHGDSPQTSLLQPQSHRRRQIRNLPRLSCRLDRHLQEWRGHCSDKENRRYE